MEALQDKIISLSNELTLIKNNLANRDQWYRLNNIEIKGIPIKKNENLFIIMDNICKAIGFPVDKSHINYISRVRVHNSKEKSIIVSFTNRNIKEDLIASARAKKKISAESGI